jgi:hypothetical protein
MTMRYSAFLLMSVLLAGCQTARVANPLTTELAGNDPQQQLDFWHTLATRPVTSNDEAFHGLLLYTDGEDPAQSYDQRVTTLKQRKMLPADFDESPEAAVTRGDLAVAICRILEVRGGLMMRLTNNHPRYATRELQFLTVYPPSSPRQTFSGNEFLGIIGRVEDYQRGNSADVPAAVMPSEMGQQQQQQQQPAPPPVTE